MKESETHPDTDPQTRQEDLAAYKRNEKATRRNRKKDNAPNTQFDSPNRIGSGEEPRNDGDKGGAD